MGKGPHRTFQEKRGVGARVNAMPRSIYSRRPFWLAAAAASTVVLALVFVVLAVASMTSGHGQFSIQVALMLVVWAALVGMAGWGMWALKPWSRGAVVAAGLLHLFAFGQMVPTAPAAAAGAALALVAAVGALLPSTRAALRGAR